VKKTILTLYLSFTISICSFAQIGKSDLLGVWVNTKTDMKDGSKLIPIYPDYVNHFEITFLKNKFITDYYPSQSKLSSSNSYQLKNDLIESSINFGYEIEKLSNDTLIIVEKMNWLEDDQLKRFYMIKKEKLLALEKSKNYTNEHLIANPFYSPEFEGSIELYLNNGLNKKYTNLKLKGKLNILLDDKKVDVAITHRDNNDPKQEKTITKLLQKSFKKWNLDGFNEYSTISIDFVIIMEKTKTYRGLRMGLNMNSFTQLLGLYGLTYKQLFDGNKIFNLGNESFQLGNYEDAINYYTESFELNHTKVEALYNRASAYIKLERYEQACSDWKKLKDLGQKQGEKLYHENCKQQ
tara:strand:+ start:92 stop:1147 length:1056 start_codon:yes stop_codon:yes gene_type:complete